jgi:hypothetical protein
MGASVAVEEVWGMFVVVEEVGTNKIENNFINK